MVIDNWKLVSEKKALIKCPDCGQEHEIEVDNEILNGRKPINLSCPNVDRRYRFVSFSFNTIRNNYRDEYTSVTEKDKIKSSLMKELGPDNFEVKFNRWLNIDYPSISIKEEYSDLIDQVIICYSKGFFFAAMTSMGALIERILNKIVFTLKHYYKTDRDYRKIYNKNSTQNWELLIELLRRWNIVNNKTEGLLNDLKVLRNEAVHYNEGYDFENKCHDMINMAISSIYYIWGVFENKSIFLVFDVPGEIWIKKSAEELPFVKEFIIPHCYRIAPKFIMESGKLKEVELEFGPLSDEQFVNIRKTYLKIN